MDEQDVIDQIQEAVDGAVSEGDLCGYTVEVDYFDDEGDTSGGELDPKYPRPSKIKNHCDILDACLAALARTGLKVTSLTTDGDGSDCEAIFRVGEQAYIIKVR